MRCEIEKLSRNTDVTIGEWIIQIESYFISCDLPTTAYVCFMLQNFAHPYFKEAIAYKDLPYLDFREKLMDISESLIWLQHV